MRPTARPGEAVGILSAAFQYVIWPSVPDEDRVVGQIEQLGLAGYGRSRALRSDMSANALMAYSTSPPAPYTGRPQTSRGNTDPSGLWISMSSMCEVWPRMPRAMAIFSIGYGWSVPARKAP